MKKLASITVLGILLLGVFTPMNTDANPLYFVFGFVEEWDGSPAEAVPINITIHNVTGASLQREAFTNMNGYFQIQIEPADIPDITHIVGNTSDGVQLVTRTVVYDASKSFSWLNMSFGFKIRGYVEDDLGQPLNDVSINSSADIDDAWANTTVTPSGYYELAYDVGLLTSGDQNIWVNAMKGTGTATCSVGYTVDSEYVWLNLTLIPSSFLVYGFVHDTHSVPLQGISINGTSQTTGLQSSTISSVTGYYQLQFNSFDLSPSGEQIYCESTDLLSVDGGAVDYVPPNAFVWLNFTLNPANFTIHGYVNDSNGQPYAGAIVSASAGLNAANYSTTTDIGGYYELTFDTQELYLGDQIIGIEAREGIYAALGVVPFTMGDAEDWLNLSMVSTLLFVRGFVTDLDGLPLVGVGMNISDSVSSLWDVYTTTSNGSYVLALSKEHMFPDEHIIGLAAVYGNISSWAAINYTEDLYQTWVNFTMETPYYTKGLVLGQDGTPLEGVQVEVVDTVTNETANAVTFPNGVYHAKLYDFMLDDQITVTATVPGGSTTDTTRVLPLTDSSWLNLSLVTDISMSSGVDVLTTEPGGWTNLSITLDTSGNIATGDIYINVSTSLFREEGSTTANITPQSAFNFIWTGDAQSNDQIIISLSAPISATDGATYPINIEMEGKDSLGLDILPMSADHTIAVSKAAINPIISPVEQEISWGETSHTSVTIENLGSEAARWLWVEAILPTNTSLADTPEDATIVGGIINWTLENVSTTQLLYLNITPTVPMADGTELVISWTFKFTNASALHPVILALGSSITVRAIELEMDAIHSSVIKGDTTFYVDITIDSITPAIPHMIWVNLSSPALVPTTNSTMVLQDVQGGAYTAEMYVPLIPSDIPTTYSITVEAVSINGWKAEPIINRNTLIVFYHYIQGNITDDGTSWTGEVTFVNSATGESTFYNSTDGFYRFDLNELSNHTYDNDILRITLDETTIELTQGTGPVQWIDIELVEPEEEGPGISDYCLVPGALILIIALFLLLSVRKRRMDEEDDAQNHKKS